MVEAGMVIEDAHPASDRGFLVTGSPGKTNSRAEAFRRGIEGSEEAVAGREPEFAAEFIAVASKWQADKARSDAPAARRQTT